MKLKGMWHSKLVTFKYSQRFQGNISLKWLILSMIYVTFFMDLHLGEDIWWSLWTLQILLRQRILILGSHSIIRKKKSLSSFRKACLLISDLLILSLKEKIILDNFVWTYLFSLLIADRRRKKTNIIKISICLVFTNIAMLWKRTWLVIKHMSQEEKLLKKQS